MLSFSYCTLCALGVIKFNIMNNKETFDYQAIGNAIEKQIDEQIKELENVKVEAREIGNPKKLVDSISQIVWEQFVLQIAGQAGKDFIEQNNNLNLSLKRADHYLNPHSFNEGRMPSHNFKNFEKYHQRYETQSKYFVRDDSGNVATHKTRMGTEVATLTKTARNVFDKDRPSGSMINHTDIDHTVSAGEIIRDPIAATYLDEAEKIKFANSEANLNEIPSDWNRSKGDYSTDDWLDHPNSNGQKPKEIFNISDRDEQKLRQKDNESREVLESLKKDGIRRGEVEGKESVKREALVSTSYVSQAIALALMAKLTRTVFQDLIQWLSEKDRKAKSFLEHLKKAITEFLRDFKNNMLLTVDVGLTVLLTQIFGLIIPMIKKALLFVKIGGESFYKVAKYLKDPVNSAKDTSIKILEIGKIVTVSLTTAGAIGFGVVITGALAYYVPPLAVLQIPLLGSVAGLLGVFFGGLSAGICGAIVLHNIEGAFDSKLRSENISKQLTIQNNVLALQDTQFKYEVGQVKNASKRTAEAINENMTNAVKEMQKMRDSINEERITENDDRLANIASLIDGLK